MIQRQSSAMGRRAWPKSLMKSAKPADLEMAAMKAVMGSGAPS